MAEFVQLQISGELVGYYFGEDYVDWFCGKMLYLGIKNNLEYLSNSNY